MAVDLPLARLGLLQALLRTPWVTPRCPPLWRHAGVRFKRGEIEGFLEQARVAWLHGRVAWVLSFLGFMPGFLLLETAFRT